MAYRVTLSSAKLGFVVGVVDVVVIVIRVVAGVVLIVGSGQTEEAQEPIAQGIASESLELLEVWLLGDHGREEHLALLGLVLFPSTLEVLKINHSFGQQEFVVKVKSKDTADESM
jgi:hypothetical protein